MAAQLLIVQEYHFNGQNVNKIIPFLLTKWYLKSYQMVSQLAIVQEYHF